MSGERTTAITPLILITEDDTFTRRLLAAYLEKEGYRVHQACTGHEMHQKFARQTPDLILLDLNLPDEDGLTLLRQLRTRSSIPVVILSTRAEESDRVAGLELGADDYVSKEWSPRELVARVSAVLNRTSEIATPTRNNASRYFVFCGYRLDADGHSLRTVDGKEITLSMAEFKLLLALVRHRGRTLTRDQLLDALGHGAEAPYDRTIDVLVSRLRKKLEQDQARPKIIRTVSGVGYQLIDETVQT